MVNKVEAEITAMQADFAHTVAWLRGDYLPSPLPKAVEERLVSFTARFDALRDMVEEREASLAFDRTRDTESIPDAIVSRLLAGENAIRVWREHRGLSLRALSERAGVSSSALSDIERGKSEGKPHVLSRIARVLGVDLDDIIPLAGQENGDGSS
jgi:ribosome-binding protein aMBF1 (putative translation factor)